MWEAYWELDQYPARCWHQNHKLQSGAESTVQPLIEAARVTVRVFALQRGIPAVSPDVLNQFPAAPVPTLSGFPVPLPGGVSQPPLLPAAAPASVGLPMGPSVMGMSIPGPAPGPAAPPAPAPAPAPAGGAAAQPSGAFLPSYPPGQVSSLPAWKTPFPGREISLALPNLHGDNRS